MKFGRLIGWLVALGILVPGVGRSAPPDANATNDIEFSLSTTNDYWGSSRARIRVKIERGHAGLFAVVMDTINYSSMAYWQRLKSTNLTIDLGKVEGWHSVWVGLRESLTTPESWRCRRIKFDPKPAVLKITSPERIVDSSIIQLRGYSSKVLSDLTMESDEKIDGRAVTRSVGTVSQSFNTNTWEYDTNYFQAFDLPLKEGNNNFVLDATDLAGNATSLHYSVVFDPSRKTNPPIVQVDWPLAGVAVCGGTYDCLGTVSDPNCRVELLQEDGLGNTNEFGVEVGRDGRFWAKGIPITTSNMLYLTVTDDAGHRAYTNISVRHGDKLIVIDPVSAGNSAITGSSSSGEPVTVNGIGAKTNGNSRWWMP